MTKRTVGNAARPRAPLPVEVWRLEYQQHQESLAAKGRTSQPQVYEDYLRWRDAVRRGYR